MPNLTNEEKRKWLTEELAELRAAEVIDEAAAQRINAYYAQAAAAGIAAAEEKPAELRPAAAGQAAANRQSYGLTAFVLVGSLLVGAGIIMLFAYNWDMLSIARRVALSFIPVLAGAGIGVYTILKEKGTRWQEVAAFLTATGFIVLTALISQIYHTGGTIEDFTLLMMALSVPLIYLFRSQLLTVAYCFCLFIFLERHWHMRVWGGYADLACLAAVAPFMAYYLLYVKPRGMRTAWMRYVALIPLLYLLLRFPSGDYHYISFFAAASMLYTIGLTYHDNGENGWRNPWLACGWFSLTVLMVICTSYNVFWRPWHGVVSLEAGPAFARFWMLLTAAGFLASFRKMTPLKAAVLLSPLLPILARAADINQSGMILAANVYFAVIAALALAGGIKSRGILRVNAGMSQLAILASIRFFDARMGILPRSAAFITVGTAFIIANVWIGRRFKKEKGLIAAEEGVSQDVEK